MSDFTIRMGGGPQLWYVNRTGGEIVNLTDGKPFPGPRREPELIDLHIRRVLLRVALADVSRELREADAHVNAETREMPPSSPPSSHELCRIADCYCGGYAHP